MAFVGYLLSFSVRAILPVLYHAPVLYESWRQCTPYLVGMQRVDI